MKSNLVKTSVACAALIAGLGFGANQASADAFSVSVHTPNVSVGYRNVDGRYQDGYIAAAPAPAYYPPPAPVVVERPVVVYRPVVVRERHECHYEQRPVTRVGWAWGRRVYHTEYVTVRTCDDYHVRHDHVRYEDRHRHDDHRRSDHRRDHDKHYDRKHGHDRDDVRHHSSNRGDRHR